MPTTDFTSPRRMSPSAFVIIFLKILNSVVGATSIYIIVKLFSSDVSLTDPSVWRWALIGFGAIIAFSLVYASISYFPKKFYIKDGNLIFAHGILSRENTSIPLDRIHSLRTRQGLWYRLLEMRGIAFDTLASKDEEIELILDESDWKSLLLRIDNEDRTLSDEHSTSTKETKPTSVMRFANRNLLLGALCQNHLKGMAILGGLIALIFDKVSDYTETDTITDYALSFADSILGSPLKITTILIAVYLLVLALWLGNVFLRYFDTTLTYDSKQLSFTHGLISRLSSRLAYDKICTIWVKRNYFEKRLGLSSLMLHQALNATSEKDDEKIRLYGTDSSAFFLKWWLGEDYNESPVIISAKSGRGLFMRSFTSDLLISSIATIALLHFGLAPWTVVPAIYLFIAFFNDLCEMRKSRITLKESHLIISSGGFADVENYVKYSNIEVTAVRRSPFTKYTHRVTLQLSTPGTNFSIKSLKEDDALLIQEILLHKTEQIKNGNTHAERT